MTKLWIDDTMYLVDDRVRERIERLETALESIGEIVSCGEDCGKSGCVCSWTMQKIATEALKG